MEEVGEWVTRVRMRTGEGTEDWWMRRLRGRRLRQGVKGGGWSSRCCFARGRRTWSGSRQQRLKTRYIVSQIGILYWEKITPTFFIKHLEL